MNKIIAKIFSNTAYEDGKGISVSFCVRVRVHVCVFSSSIEFWDSATEMTKYRLRSFLLKQIISVC